MQKLLLFLLVLLGLNIPLQAQTSETRNFVHDGEFRSYRLFIPEGTVSRLLIALHPFGSSGLGMQYLTGLNQYASEKGFAVAYPNALSYYWDEGRSAQNVGPDNIAIDDLGFIAALSSNLKEELEIDDVYLTGMGSGAGLAYLAACTHPENYQAVAIVATGLWDYQALSCLEEQSAPINMLVLWGDKDPLFSFIDTPLQISRRESILYGTEHTKRFWLERNDCELNDTQRELANVEIYPCADEHSFAFITLANTGANWPRKGDYQLNQFDVDASEIIANYIMDEPTWYETANQNEPSTATPRTWILYVPSSYDASNPTPLVVLLHGRGGTGSSQAYVSDFRAVAEREGLIAVFPDGIDNQWNYIRDMPRTEGVGPQDDDEFLTNLVDDISLDLNIDQSQVYVTGYSNGGFMSQRLVCTRENRFAAFASVAATGAYGLPEYCQGTSPKPVLYIHGTEDNIVPFDGQTSQTPDGSSFYISAPMSRTLSYWSDHNGCDGASISSEDLPQSSELSLTRILRVDSCPDDAPITLYMVIGGGHVWPGIRPTDEFLGYSSTDFNASDVIWDFFSQFSLAE